MGEEADDSRDDGTSPDILIHLGPHRPFKAAINYVSHIEISTRLALSCVFRKNIQ
jgi:hypothetical protein